MIRFIPGLPAFEYHEEKGCKIFIHVDPVWHAWNLPCCGTYHQLATDDSVKDAIDKIRSGEIPSDPTKAFSLLSVLSFSV